MESDRGFSDPAAKGASVRGMRPAEMILFILLATNLKVGFPPFQLQIQDTYIHFLHRDLEVSYLSKVQ